MKRVFFVLFASLLMFYPRVCYSQNFGTDTSVLTPKNKDRVVVQTIGIRYKQPGMDLSSSADLNQYEDFVDNNLFGYKSHQYRVPLNGYLTKDSITNCLQQIEFNTKASDIVIIHIIGHGEYDAEHDMYYLLCNDKKLSGDVILSSLQKMANKGALVIIFLDTCNSGAICKKLNNRFVKNKNGGIVFYASSNFQQDSSQLQGSTKFSTTILNTFAKGEVLTLSLLSEVISKKVKSKDQTPETKFLPLNGTIDEISIENYPIIKQQVHIKKISSYIGAAFGYPYASFFAGLSLWQHLKIEIGCSYLNAKESDDVYLYSSTNPSPFGYRYSTNNLRLYLQSGWEFDLGKDWYLTPMVGVSYLSLSGNPISGYKSDSGIRNGASAVCLTTNARLSFAPFKNKHWELSVTAGKEWGVGDSNYKLIRDYIDHKAIEGFRGQLGITYNF